VSISATTAADSTDACRAEEGVFAQLSCYVEAAKAAGDYAVCKQASHETVRYQCLAIYAEHAKSPAPCRDIPRRGRDLSALVDVCLSDVAAALTNPALCEEIGEPGLKDSCYLKIARETGGQSLCPKIQDQGLKSLCTGEPVYVE
jgi:hypothetical protein